jgi:hypothetical protein
MIQSHTAARVRVKASGRTTQGFCLWPDRRTLLSHHRFGELVRVISAGAKCRPGSAQRSTAPLLARGCESQLGRNGVVVVGQEALHIQAVHIP